MLCHLITETMDMQSLSNISHYVQMPWACASDCYLWRNDSYRSLSQRPLKIQRMGPAWIIPETELNVYYTPLWATVP